MSSFETVIVSDLHLGARNARTSQFLEFLDWVRADRLILAGDLLDKPHANGLGAQSLRVLEALNHYARRHDLVWLPGNHDPRDICLPGFAALVQDEIVIDVGSRRYLVCHGHKWDRSLELPQWVIDGADSVYQWAQWLDPAHRAARNLKRACKYFCRTIENLQRHAAAEAQSRSLDGVVVGHSHVARHTMIDGIHYLNSGCWTETPSAFIGVQDGRARRYYWEAICRNLTRRRGAIPTQAQPPFALDMGVPIQAVLQEAI